MALSDVLSQALLDNSSISQLSAASGADAGNVEQLIKAALPKLMKSMEHNASTPGGQQSLEKALADHAKDDTSDILAFLSNADTTDGAKILKNIFGSSNSTVQAGLAKKAGLTKAQTSSILSSIAPLLLTLIGSNLIGGGSSSSSSSSGGLLSVLASALFGGDDEEEPAPQSSSANDGFGLDDVAGILLGTTNDANNTGELVGGLISGLLSNNKKNSTKKPASGSKAKKKPASSSKPKKKPASGNNKRKKK